MTDLSELRRVRLEIYGRVQGVFFRQTLHEAASRLGLSGSAVNRNDGSVLAFFEGRPSQIEAAIAVARSGPPSAKVDRVELIELEPTGESGFSVG